MISNPVFWERIEQHFKISKVNIVGGDSDILIIDNHFKKMQSKGTR
jgi:hypothetical protein